MKERKAYRNYTGWIVKTQITEVTLLVGKKIFQSQTLVVAPNFSQILKLNKHVYSDTPCNMETVSWLPQNWCAPSLCWKGHPNLGLTDTCSGSWSNQVHSSAMTLEPKTSIKLHAVPWPSRVYRDILHFRDVLHLQTP